VASVDYSQGITGLTQARTYYFCAIAANSAGTSFGSLVTFNTASPPYIQTLNATNVTYDSAKLNGIAIANGSATTGWFRYDTVSPGTCNDTFGTRAPASGGWALGSANLITPYSQTITGLSAATVVYFCAIDANAEGTSFGTVRSFTTTNAPIAVSGTVTYGNAIGAPSPRFVSNVTITGDGTPPINTTTGGPGPTAGQYSLTGFGSGAYTITPSKIGGVNGFSTFDAAKIAQHAAGISTLNATQLIVADVSDDGTVSSYDAAMIGRWAVGNPPFGLTGTWKFIPVSRTYPQVTSDITGQDYTAYLMGEVSGNWTNTGARSTNGFDPNDLSWLTGGGF
jgi:hypothetical protein